MTFMRKIIDILNMDNWGKTSDKKIYATNNFSNPTDTFSSVTFAPRDRFDVQKICTFYQCYPQENTFSKDPTQLKEFIIYAKTLILDSFEKPAPIRDNYPAYFLAECHITNPRKLIKELIKEGYLGSPSLYQILNLYKVSELKIICDSIGCKKSGNKAEIINRVLNCLPPESAKQYAGDIELYSLTEKGITFLQDNYDYIQLHRFRCNITLHEFNANRFIGNKKRSFNDNIYSLLSNRIYNNCCIHNYYWMEFDYSKLYEITLSEGRYDLAIRYLLSSIHLKTCCVRIVSIYKFRDSYYEDSINHEIIFTSKISLQIIDLSQYYKPYLVDEIYDDLSLPYSFLNLAEFKQSISDMLSEISFDSEKYNNIIRFRLKQYIQLLPDF